MAKVKTQKARKNYKCSKCNAEIKTGETYYKIVARFKTPSKRCQKCRPRQSELTSSEVLSTVYSMHEEFEDMQKTVSGVSFDSLISFCETSQDTVQNLISEQEEKIQNIEEYFPNGTPASEQLQEYIDELESLSSELDNAKSEIENIVEQKEGLEEQIKEFAEAKEKTEDAHEADEIDDKIEEVKDEQEHLIDDAIETVDNALQSCSL